MPTILNPDLYKKAKEIADQKFETHGAYKSAFLVKTYKELGGEYKDDGKPKKLSRWLKEQWKDVAGLPYPVYRPTKRVSSETPLTADEVSTESLAKNAVLKQIYGAERNLPPFEAKMKGGQLDETFPTIHAIIDLYRRVRNEWIDEPSGIPNWGRLQEIVSQFYTQYNIPPGSARYNMIIAHEPRFEMAINVIHQLVTNWGVTLASNIDFVPPVKFNDLLKMKIEMNEGDFEGAGFYKMENGCSLYTGGALSKKRITSFANSVQSVFNLLSISRKYKVVGSAALNEIKYSADYDLNEFFKEDISDKGEILNRLYKVFRDKFKVAAADPNIYITDFKCGEDSDGEPLRWSYADMMRGTKTLENGRTVSFQECLLMKASLKLDMVVVIDDRFVEFSDNYFLKLGEESNYFPHDISQDHVLNGLKHDYYFNIQSSGNLMKALKRLFSYLRLENEGKNEAKLDKLVEFFNSETGMLYKINSEIKTIITIIDNTFRVAPRNQVRENLSLILPELRGNATAPIRARLSAAMAAKTKTQQGQYLADASKMIQKIINESAADFISKNKNLIVL
jgi:hypothetical protein